MQFSVLTVLTLITAVMANPLNKRQIDPSVPSMTDKDGNIVPFSSKNVYQPLKERALKERAESGL